MSDKTQIKQIIQIRQKPLSDVDKDSIADWQNAKAYYALDDWRNNAESMAYTQHIFDMIKAQTRKEG